MLKEMCPTSGAENTGDHQSRLLNRLVVYLALSIAFLSKETSAMAVSTSLCSHTALHCLGFQQCQ